MREQIYFHDPGGEIWKQEQEQKINGPTKNRQPHSHPDESNLQIYHVMGNTRVEHIYMEFQDHTPTTKAQKDVRKYPSRSTKTTKTLPNDPQK